MKIEEFAHTLLFGTRLEDKLLTSSIDWMSEEEKSEVLHPHGVALQPNLHSPPSSFETPLFPGRPERLRRLGKSEFPSVHQLKLDSERGKVLHFFANHELLAMELMALVLLKFPHAPLAYRQGVARIIAEEQNHLRLYLTRMRELGIDFGDLPVNDYFWNCMKNIASPLDFTVQMSLTFEQANLDFSLFYLNEVSRVGDQATAHILERVFREEIGHVKHGLTWFNRWRTHASTQSDWEEYQKLLPYPLNPQRAKGQTFSEEARRQAGLSETFIQELKVYSGSKGRPPSLWLYNSHCDAEIARGKPGYSPSLASQRTAEDLAHLPLFLARPQDILITQKRPSTAWLNTIQEAGFTTPEFLPLEPRQDFSSQVRADKLAGFEPWGWSPDALESFRPLRNRLIEIEGGNASFCHSLYAEENTLSQNIQALFSKSWSTNFLRAWMQAHPESFSYFGSMEHLGSAEQSLETTLQRATLLLEKGTSVMIKAPFGTSGMQNKKIQTLRDLSSAVTLGWIKRILKEQNSIVVEPYLNKVFDLSVQFEVRKERTQILEVRRFITGNRYQYQGTYLGKRMVGFERAHHELFHHALSPWHELIRDLGQAMRNQGYLGPAGVDALIYESSPHEEAQKEWKAEGNLQERESKKIQRSFFLKPLVELNPRWTMGRIALELEKHIDPSVPAIWKWISTPEILKLGYSSLKEYAESLQKKHPLLIIQSHGKKILKSGVLITNDPESAHSFLTLLWVNPPQEG